MAALIQFKDGVEGVTLRLEQPLTRLGRGTDNDVTLHDELVSKHHAVIEAVANPGGGYHYLIEDRGSTNGTFVNDERIELCRLQQDDVIRLGVNHFRFVDDANDDLAATTKIQKTWLPGVYVARRKPKQ
jgi:pSer/pThr/pTyr-binding forkhead associated (FHA) protein